MPSQNESHSEFAKFVFAELNSKSEERTTCIQVGAFDGKRWDPIYNEVTTNGWTLYPLEPHPEHYQQLCKNYEGFARVCPKQIAISDKNETLMLYCASKEARRKFPAWLQGCSSVHLQRFNQAVEIAVRSSKESRGTYDVDAVQIEAITLDQFIAEQNIANFDVLVVVAEGHERQILSSLRNTQQRPKLAIVQCNGLNRAQEPEYLTEMKRLGLSVWRFGDDLWGIDSELTSTPGYKKISQQIADAELTKKIEAVPKKKPATQQRTPAQSASGNTGKSNGQPSTFSQCVPKKLGHIWIGYKAPPTKWMMTWQEKHPDWNYQLFDNDYLVNRRWRNEKLIAEYVRRGRFEGASDLMRYEILLEQGGFIPEADSTCLQNTDFLFSQPSLYTVYEHESREPGFVSPFLASVENHPFLEKLVQHLFENQSPKSLRGPFVSVGNMFLGEMINQYQPEVSIFPSYFFIPNHLRSKKFSGTGPVFADQHWGSSKKSYADYPLEETVAHATKLRDWARSILG